jgi:exodeoxyribonuclease VII large subunit
MPACLIFRISVPWYGVKEGIDIAHDLVRFQQVYSPSTLLGVFSAAIKSPADARLILARGIYQPAPASREYAGYFYDSLKGVHDNGIIKLRLPSLLRSKLKQNHVYVFRGFVEKRIGFSAIELILTVDDILQEEQSPVTGEDLRRFSLLQQKITKGYRDFESLVKESVYKGEPLRIANIYGTSAIVDKDFQRGIGDSVSRFSITDYRCSFASRTDIIRWLRNLDATGCHAIGLVRGGGDGGLEIFNDPEIGEVAVAMKAIFVTALGHTVNHTLLDKLADRKFDLPHQYGSSLKRWIDEATDEQARSRTRFIDQVKTDLEKVYREQISVLQSQLTQSQKEKEEKSKSQEEMVHTLRETFDATARAQVEAAIALANFRIASVEAEHAREKKRTRRRLSFLLLVIGILAGGLAFVIALLASTYD